MTSLLIFDKVNDLTFTSLSEHLSEIIQALSKRNGYDLQEASPSNGILSRDAIVQIFSPLISSYRIMRANGNPYEYISNCEDGTNIIFDNFLEFTFLVIGKESLSILQHLVKVCIVLVKRICGIDINLLKQSRHHSRVLENVLVAWSESLLKPFGAVGSLYRLPLINNIFEVKQEIINELREFSKNIKRDCTLMVVCKGKVVTILGSNHKTEELLNDRDFFYGLLLTVSLENNAITDFTSEKESEFKSYIYLSHNYFPYKVHLSKVHKDISCVLFEKLEDRSEFTQAVIASVKAIMCLKESEEIQRNNDHSKVIEILNASQKMIKRHLKGMNFQNFNIISEMDEFIKEFKENGSLLRKRQLLSTLTDFYRLITLNGECLHENLMITARLFCHFSSILYPWNQYLTMNSSTLSFHSYHELSKCIPLLGVLTNHPKLNLTNIVYVNRMNNTFCTQIPAQKILKGVKMLREFICETPFKFSKTIAFKSNQEFYRYLIIIEYKDQSLSLFNLSCLKKDNLSLFCILTDNIYSQILNMVVEKPTALHELLFVSNKDIPLDVITKQLGLTV